MCDIRQYLLSTLQINIMSVSTSMSGCVQGLCGSSVHKNSLEGACAQDGSRIVDWLGLVIVFLGIALTGVGNSLFWCFGMVYLDDNSGKGNSPFMLSLTFVFKLIGPTFGRAGNEPSRSLKLHNHGESGYYRFHI